MTDRFKYLGIILIALFLIAASYGVVSRELSRRAVARNFTDEQKRHAETIENLRDTRSRVAYLSGALDAASIEAEELRTRIMDDARTIRKLERRRAPISTPFEKTPADCEQCLAGWRLPLVVDTRWAWCGTEDAFTEDLRIRIKPEYNREVTRSYRDGIEVCTHELARSEPYHPLRLTADGTVGLGLNGQFVLPGLWLETGRRWQFGLGVGVPVTLDPMGDVWASPSAMVRLRYRIWPR